MNIEKEEEERRYKEAAASGEAKTLDSRVLSNPVRVLNPRAAVRAQPDETVLAVVERMAAERQGCALVVKDDRLAGIFTERDLMTRVLARGKDPATLSVGDVMTSDPESLTLDDTLGYALHKMSVGSYRHVPIVDGKGHPVSVITQQEGVRYLVGFFPAEAINNPPRSIEQAPPTKQYGG